MSFVQRRVEPDESHTFGQDSLHELDLESRESTEILRLPNALHGYAWSPDGTLLAYQVRAETANEVLPLALCLFNTQTGRLTLLRQLGPWAGRGTNQRDEVSIAWSSNARSILVIDTFEQGSVQSPGPRWP